MLDICDNELLINELKCNQCSKILSQPPVYCSSGNGNLCGRCFEVSDTLIKDGSMQQAVAYEAVAQFLLFPCCNHERGCKTKLKWKEAAQHEQECEFASSPCPFNLEFENTSIKCDWIGIRSDLSLHLNNKHNKELHLDLLSSHLEVDVTYVKMFFTVIDNLTFLVITKFVKILNKFYCAVVCCGDLTDHRLFRYQLELGHNNDCNDLILNKSETERFSNIQEIITNEENMIVVDIAVLQALVRNLKKSMYYKISIVKNSKENEERLETDAKTPANESTASSEQSNQKNANVDKYLDEIECPVCNEYMAPPILLCATGHSVCNSCKSKMQFCPVCQNTFQDGRNLFTLEKLTTKFKYPCNYQNFGCNVRLNLTELESHQRVCSYGFQECPWKTLGDCNAEDVIDIIGHFRDNHTDYMIDVDKFCRYEICENYYNLFVIYDNQIFIYFVHTGEQFKFNFIHLMDRGMNNTKSKYKYKLEFKNQSDNNLELIVSQLCQTSPSFNRLSAFNECLSIPEKLVKPFINKDPLPRVRFKFNIQKI